MRGPSNGFYPTKLILNIICTYSDLNFFSSNIMTEKPDKPQTKFNKCLANSGFGYDVIRCSNWQRNGEMSNPQNDGNI